jgi:hypothetical protein
MVNSAQRSLRGQGGIQSKKLKRSESQQPLLNSTESLKTNTKKRPVIKKKNKPKRSRYDILKNLNH